MTPDIKKKVLVAMSGGVDSSVAVKLLLDRGYDVAGATMRLLPGADAQVEGARLAAEKLGVEFHVFELEKEFEHFVINSFCRAYELGRTPNPCVICNRFFKFGVFLDKALDLGFDLIATGHYAKNELGEDGRFHLKKAKDLLKDQSYFLFGLRQEVLEKVLFPLGDIGDKQTVRGIAEAAGLKNAKKKDSQDICFVPDGNYLEIIDRYYEKAGKKRMPGNFVDVNGKVLGRHRGIERFTIGQRKGVGVTLGETPMYVISKNANDNTVLMGSNDLLMTDEITALDPVFPAVRAKEKPVLQGRLLSVKTRSGQKFSGAHVSYDPAENVIKAKLIQPVRAVAPGQYAVFYDGDEVVCGGEIL